MKTTFKKLLGTVLVAATIVTAMSVGMATQVFAAENSYELYYDNSKTLVNTDNHFTITDGSAISGADNLVAGRFTNIAGEIFKTQNCALRMEKPTTVTFEVDGTARVTIVASPIAGQSNPPLLVDGVVVAVLEGDAITECTVILNAGVHTISRFVMDTAVYYVKVVDTVPDTEKTYTITGKSDLPDDSFTLSKDSVDYTVETDGSGDWTLDVVAEIAPFKAGDEFDVLKNEYEVSPSKLKIHGVTGAPESYTTYDTLNFSKLPLQDPLTLVAGGALYVDGADTYIIAGVNEDKLGYDEVVVTINWSNYNKSIDYTSKIYESVAIGDRTITADELDVNVFYDNADGTSGNIFYDYDYVYAIKITNANGATDMSFSTDFY